MTMPRQAQGAGGGAAVMHLSAGGTTILDVAASATTDNKDGRTGGKQADGRTNGRTNGKTDGQTDRRKDGQKDAPTDKRTERRTDGRSSSSRVAERRAKRLISFVPPGVSRGAVVSLRSPRHVGLCRVGFPGPERCEVGDVAVSHEQHCVRSQAAALAAFGNPGLTWPFLEGCVTLTCVACSCV